MGYVLWADLLGVKSLTEVGVARSRTALDRFTRIACWAGRVHLVTDVSRRHLHESGFRFQDTVVFYSDSLISVVEYAAKIAWRLFLLPAKEGGPIILRGTICKCPSPPTFDGERHPRLRVFTVIPETLSDALAAEASKVLGGRILVSPTVFDVRTSGEALVVVNSSWPIRAKALLFHINGGKRPSIPFASYHTLAVPAHLADYLDVSWLNLCLLDQRLSSFEKVKSRRGLLLAGTVSDNLSSAHAAATAALFDAMGEHREHVAKTIRLAHRYLAGEPIDWIPPPPINYHRGVLQVGRLLEEEAGVHLPVATTVNIRGRSMKADPTLGQRPPRGATTPPHPLTLARASASEPVPR